MDDFQPHDAPGDKMWCTFDDEEVEPGPALVRHPVYDWIHLNGDSWHTLGGIAMIWEPATAAPGAGEAIGPAQLHHLVPAVMIDFPDADAEIDG